METNQPENRTVIDIPERDDEETLVTPRFDTDALRQAKPAVPLSEIIARRANPKLLIVAVLIAGVIGSIIGSILSVRYFNQQGESKPGVSESAQTSGPQDSLPATGEKAPPKSSNANQSQVSSPITKPVEATGLDNEKSAKEPEPEQAPSRETINEKTEDQVPEEVDQETKKLELHRAFQSWLKANKESDAEVGETDIKVSPNGEQATIRYHKNYRSAGDDSQRAGKIQELRWKRINSKWQIVSERDMKISW